MAADAIAPVRQRAENGAVTEQARQKPPVTCPVDVNPAPVRADHGPTPWHVAFALQDDGWILRSAIIWHKPNAMPEPVRDRVSTRYEMVFMLTKQQHYFFNLAPIREPLARPPASTRRVDGAVDGKYARTDPFSGKRHGQAMRPTGTRHTAGSPQGRNPGDVWSITTRPLREAHFAAFPIDLPLRCITAGCPS